MATSQGTGLYVRLDANYYEDDKFLQVTENAELLYVRALCLCKRIVSDGRISLRQIDRIAPESGGESGREMADQLVRVGLWKQVDIHTFSIGAWHKWNASAEEVKAIREGGDYGNHLRWHQNRQKPKSGCVFCFPADESSPGDSGGRIGGRFGGDSGGRIPETETETETVSRALPRRKPRTQVPDDYRPGDTLTDWAREKFPARSLEWLEAETAKFVDHHRAKGSLFASVDGAWRNWIRRADEWERPAVARAAAAPNAPATVRPEDSTVLRMLEGR